VAATTVVALAAAVLEDVDLLAALVLQDFGGDRRTSDSRGTDLCIGSFPHEEDLVKGKEIPFVLTRVLVNNENVAWLDGELATGGDKCGLHGCRKVGANGGKGGWQGDFRFGGD